jgi:hypothetical protein
MKGCYNRALVCDVGCWPGASVADIGPARYLSGNKRPNLGTRKVLDDQGIPDVMPPGILATIQKTLTTSCPLRKK